MYVCMYTYIYIYIYTYTHMLSSGAVKTTTGSRAIPYHAMLYYRTT